MSALSYAGILLGEYLSNLADDIGDGLHLSQAGSDRVGELLWAWTSSRK